MTSFALRAIAVTAMLIDHAGAMFFDGEPYAMVFRAIGRIAMPLFCFLIAEGLYHTRDVRKYLLRLAAFAAVSEIPFDWFRTQGQTWLDAEFTRQNVFFTLLLGLLGILLYDMLAARGWKWGCLLAILTAAATAELFRSDYGAVGVLFIFVFYRFRHDKRMLVPFFLAAVLISAGKHYANGAETWALVTLFQAAALLFVLSYNGKRGPASKPLQYAFYAFYPVHMLLLTGVTS